MVSAGGGNPGGNVGRSGAGVVRVGGAFVGKPSPAGEWAPQWNDQTVDFDRDEFARFISDKGYDVCWERGVLCPNVPGSGLSPRDHVIGCPVCGGFGYIYVDPCPTKMLMQGIRMQQSFYAYGQWTTGNMMVTAMPEFTINSWDRLTLSNGVGRFTERVVRQPGSTVDVLRYNPLCVLYVGWVSRPPANTLTTFQCGVDFDVSQDGSSIEWLGTNQPDAGSFYSVDYEYRPRYVVQELVHHHRVSTVQGKHYVFPVQAVAKLDYLIRDVSADPQQVVDHNPFDPPAGR